MSWKLQAINPELDGQEISISQNTIVGRQEGVGLQLQASNISRQHAQLELRDTALWVQDLKSANGTYVNDLRIDADTMLKQGDIVQFANIKFNVLAPTEMSGSRVPQEGMPSLAERAQQVALGEDGLPQQIPVPKPAPLPEHVALNNSVTSQADQAQPFPQPAEPQVVPIQTKSEVEQKVAEKNNANLGLWVLMVLMVLILIACLVWYVA